jgi:hypothetical protein
MVCQAPLLLIHPGKHISLFMNFQPHGQLWQAGCHRQDYYHTYQAIDL